MKEYLTLEYDFSELSIQKARRLTEEEKKGYSEWFQEVGFISTSEPYYLPYVSWTEALKIIQNRKSDGSFLGCNNNVYIITEEEKTLLAELNSRKENEKKDRERQELIEKYRNIVFACECQSVLYSEDEARAKAAEYNNTINEGGFGFVPHFYTKKEYDYAKQRLLELGYMDEPKDVEPSKELVLEAHDPLAKKCVIKFTENGWEVLKDEREMKVGYLHATPDSPQKITSGVRESLIRYFNKHENGLPGLGGTTQSFFLHTYNSKKKDVR